MTSLFIVNWSNKGENFSSRCMANMTAEYNYLIFVLILMSICHLGSAIQCYQCDSNEDASCPSTIQFDRNLNALVDCNSFEAKIPGLFCMKVTQQSPGWRAWKKVTRRCGSRSDTGVAWGCRWAYEENGVWKETCYCDDRDGCNTAAGLPSSVMLIVGTLICTILHRWL